MSRAKLTMSIQEAWAGERVRVIWNPAMERWHVYNLEDSNHPLFTTRRLELHTVGVYGELKPKFAPDGAPSFIGNVTSEFVLDTKTATRVRSHRYAPAKTYFDLGEPGDENLEPFSHCRRLLLDGPAMFADRRHKHN